MICTCFVLHVLSHLVRVLSFALRYRLGIIKEMEPQYVATFSEKPQVLDGHPFVVEAGVSLGGAEVLILKGEIEMVPPPESVGCLAGISICRASGERFHLLLLSSCADATLTLDDRRFVSTGASAPCDSSVTVFFGTRQF